MSTSTPLDERPTQVSTPAPATETARGGRSAVVVVALLALMVYVLGHPVPAGVLLATIPLVAVCVVSPRSVRGVALGLSVGLLFTLSSAQAPAAARYGAIAMSIALMVLAERRGQARSRLDTRVSMWLPVLAFAGLCLVEFWSTAVSQSANPLTMIPVFVVPNALALLLASRSSAQDRRAMAFVILAVALANVAVAVVDRWVTDVPFFGYATINGQRLGNPLLTDDSYRSQGLSGHPIVFGMLCVVGLLTAWFFRVSRFRLVSWAMIAVMFFGLVIGGSRSSVIGIVAIAVFLVVVRSKHFLAYVVSIVGIGIVAVGLARVPATSGYLIDAYSRLRDSGSYSHRAGAWESMDQLASTRSLWQFMMGSGRGSQMDLFTRGALQQDRFFVIDNQIVTSFVTTGALGVTLLLLAMVIAFWQGDNYVRALIICLAAMFNTFDAVLWAGPALVLAIALGLAVSTASERSSQHAADVNEEPPLHAAHEVRS